MIQAEQTYAKPAFMPKLFGAENFKLKSEKLTPAQIAIFAFVIIISIVAKIILIPYNMMDMGDSATRVWNALWWAQNPFFVMPESGHPGWFYIMGPIIMLTKEFFYTSIFTMIAVMTIAGIFIFKTTLILSDFKTALLSFFIVTLNPAIFRLNFEPYAQQTYLACICIVIYYFLKAAFSEKSTLYFIAAGIFAFLALFARPEAIFVILALCLAAFMTRRKGNWYFIILALLFQAVWIGLSYYFYDEPLRTFNAADQYTGPLDIQTISTGLRLKGFFLPYYFLVLGLTVFIFYYFIKGFISLYKHYPKVILLVLLVPILIPALVNGAAGAKSTIYHTTHYIYLMFFISPVIAAIGLSADLSKIKSSALQFGLASVIIFSCIPLSYVKDFVPEKYNKMFPKIIQFIVTSDEPEEAWKLVKFVDQNINSYPALIFDADANASSILYVPFRTKLAPPEKIMISSYNIPADYEGLRSYIKNFMHSNPRGIIMIRKEGTLMNQVFTDLLKPRQYKREGIELAQETDKWFIYTYHPNGK